jgi:ligand-binding sensor domain-containing protein
MSELHGLRTDQEVLPLSSFNRLFVFGLLLAIIAMAACEDNVTPPRPEEPPQIKVRFRYTLSPGLPEDTTSGLQSNQAYDILVDAQNRTWVATQAGVSRFRGQTGDGTWNQNNVLPNPKCRALLEHNGKLWVGTSGGGAAVYDMAGDVWSWLNVDSGLVNDNVNDIAAIGDSIYFATSNGANIYIDDDQLAVEDRWYTYPVGRPLGILTPIISSVEIALTPRGMEVWFAPRMQSLISPGDEDNYGVTRYMDGDPAPAYITMVSSDLSEANVNDILYDADTDLFWLAFPSTGIASLDVNAKKWTYYRMADGLPDNAVYSITKVGEVIWVGTQSGVARLKSDGTWQGYGRAGGLPENRVRRVYSDSPSNLWTCYVDKGAALLDPTSAE